MKYRIVNLDGNTFTESIDSDIHSIKRRIYEMMDWDDFKYCLIQIENYDEPSIIYYIGYAIKALDWCESIIKE